MKVFQIIMEIYFRKKTPLSASLLLIGLIATLIVSKTSQVYSKERKETLVELPAEAKDILTGKTPEQKLYIIRKIDFIRNATIGTSIIIGSADSDLSFEFQSQQPVLYLTKKQLHKSYPHGPDPFGQELHRKLSDTPPTLSLFSAYLFGVPDAVEKTPKSTFIPHVSIPSNTEIDVLKVLWQQPGSSSSEIYANLDTVTQVTSEDLQKVLESMSDRGLLARKKISPSHNFSLFGIVSFELSSQNRKNRLYVYWPIVPKARLITYVDSQRYLALASTKNNSIKAGKYSYQKYLAEKLYRLVQ